jgi:hypothetical protein
MENRLIGGEMLNRWTVTVLSGAVAFCSFCSGGMAQQYYAKPMPDGTYQVYNPTTKQTEYVKDVKAWAAKEQFNRTGFGGGLSHYEFQKGHSPVKDTVKTAARTVDAVANTAVNTAVDAAGYVPGWRRYSNGLRQALHGGSGQARR